MHFGSFAERRRWARQPSDVTSCFSAHWRAVACLHHTVSNWIILYRYPSFRIAFRMIVAHSGRFLEVSMTPCQVSLLPVKIEEENVLFKQIGHRIMVWRIHRPRLEWLWSGLPPSARHDEDGCSLNAWRRVLRVCWFRTDGKNSVDMRRDQARKQFFSWS